MWHPKLPTVLWAEWANRLLLAGDAVPGAPQDIAGLPGCQGTADSDSTYCQPEPPGPSPWCFSPAPHCLACAYTLTQRLPSVPLAAVTSINSNPSLYRQHHPLSHLLCLSSLKAGNHPTWHLCHRIHPTRFLLCQWVGSGAGPKLWASLFLMLLALV